MSLLDKTTYFLKPGLAILLIPFFFACNDPNELGLELEPDESPFSLSDTTFTLPASTVYLDSLRTDHFNYTTVFGKYQDSIYGEVRAISYNQYNISGGTLPDNDSLEYASANLILQVAAMRSTNILGDQSISVHQANERLFSQAVYLADRPIPYDPNPIASHAIGFPSDSIIHIPLSDEFGRSLYNLLELATTDDDYQDSLTNNRFRFDPLVLVPGDDNDALYSFDFTPDTVGIYVNMINTYTGDISSFTFDFRDAHYTEVQRDISSSQKLGTLNADFEESNTSSSRTYLNMLAGVYTKIDLQPLLNFIDGQNNLLVNLSEISLGVGNINEQGFYPKKPPIQFFFVKKDGTGMSVSRRIDGPGASLATSHSMARSSAVLSESSYLSGGLQLFTSSYDTTDLNYQGNITLFIQALADAQEFSEDFLADELLILTPDPLGLGQVSFLKPEIRVTVYYTTLKN